MLDKLIVLYSFFIILNPAIKLCTAADLRKNTTSVADTRVRNTRVNSVTEADEDTWQPIIQTHKWLAKPTTLTPSLSVSMTPTRASDLWHSTNLRNNLANNSKQKQQGYIKPQTYHSPAYNHHQQQHQHQYHHNGNYSKRHIKSSTASSQSTLSLPSSSAPSQSIKDIKLRSHVYSTTNNKNNIKNSRGKGKTQTNSHHHQQQQQQIYPLNNIESVYPQIQIPKDIISQVQEQKPLIYLAKNEKNSISSKLNLSHIEDVATAKHSSSTSGYWRYLQQPQLEAKHIISLTPKIDTSKVNTMNTTTNSNVNINTFSNGNAKNVKNSSNSLTKTLNSFVTNENLIDNEITNTKKHQQHIHNPHHHQHYAAPLLQSGGVKSVTQTSYSNNAADENPIKSTKSHPVDATDANAATDDEKNFNGKLLLLRKTLNNAQEFYDNFKNIILSDKDNSDSSDNDDDTDDYDIYSNEDNTSDDDNDLQILNSSPYQTLKDTSTTVAAAITAAMDSLNMKNMLMPLASMGEVQGRRRQIGNGKVKYSSPQDTNQMQNGEVVKATAASASNETQATGRLVNLLSTKSSSSLLSPSTSKALAAISSGRKVKKVKKKFKKFLLPLVLAYKLKFMALIPLLIGGLTLLVGTTGLAGFFFALFTAVMSLKSGSRNAIVVKKY